MIHVERLAIGLQELLCEGRSVTELMFYVGLEHGDSILDF